MSIVFFHIPRTGGTVIWHSMVKMTETRGMIVADLYWQSGKMFNDPHRPVEMLSVFDEYFSKAGFTRTDPRIVYHHHTKQNICAWLRPEENRYVTILRDPVDRLVSELFVLREFLIEAGTRPAATTFGAPRRIEGMLEGSYYGDEFYAAAADPSVSPDDLISLYVENEFHRNYYINYFFSLLWGNPAQRETKYNGDARCIVPLLASTVRDKFSYVGLYPSVSETLREIFRFNGFRVPADNEFTNGAPGTKKPVLLPSSVEKLREFCELDYQFMDLVFDKAGSAK